MYQLGSFFIFGQKLIRVYVRSCIKNALLSISKNAMGAGGCFFRLRKFLLRQNHIDFDINNSLKFCSRNFKNNEIDCTISQRKIHSELQKFKKGNVAAIWNQVICLKN